MSSLVSRFGIRTADGSGKYSCGTGYWRRSSSGFRLKSIAPVLKGPAIALQPELPCPKGCECLDPNTAPGKFECPERCLQDSCGTAPGGEFKYCFMAGEMPSVPPLQSCPSGCLCMLEERAASLGAMEKCSEIVCGYSEDSVPMYCFDLNNAALEG